MKSWLCRLFLCLAAGWLSGCAWKIHPPAEVQDPVPVYLTEYGRHTRVALPVDSRRFMEYGFGEWNFYGLEKNGALDGLRAIFGMGEGAFSRRELAASHEGRLDLQTSGGFRSERLEVERKDVRQLMQVLEARWSQNEEVRIREWDAVPVSRDPVRYHLFYNSNHVAAKWLRDLGCEISGTPVFSNFSVAHD